MYCPNCGNQLNDTDAFCGACGHKIANAEPTEKDVSPAPSSVSEEVTQTPAEKPTGRKRLNKWAVIIPICAVAAVIAVVLIVWRPFDNGSSVRPAEDSSTTVNAPEDVKPASSASDPAGAEYEVISFGTYEQDNDLSNGREPIRWLVLEETDQGILLLSRHNLDNRFYNDVFEETSWADCTLRSWLNSTFYDLAFSEEEAARIITVDHDGAADAVFILSEEEISQYLDDRVSRNTPFARDRLIHNIYENGGANLSVDGQLCTTEELATRWLENIEQQNGNTSWNYWVRSGAGSSADYIGYTGERSSQTVTSTNSVRPAVWISRGESAPLAESAAETPAAGPIDLSRYLGAAMEQVEQDFPQLGGFVSGTEVDGKPVYSIRQNGMSFTASYYGTDDFSAEPAVDTVTIFGETECTVLGITYGMPFEDATRILDQQGFTYTVQNDRLIMDAFRGDLRVVIEAMDGAVIRVGIQIPSQAYPFQ